ncbi:MAG: hypothetical protein ACK58T_24735, partial [Phycisphaerae bacterium]
MADREIISFCCLRSSNSNQSSPFSEIAMPETSMAQRAKRNADYLRKVFGTADLAEAKSKLESAIGGGGGGSLSDLQVAAGGDNERNPLESLDVLNEDPWGSSL